jgi:DNA-binding GntR family transcriptional regulator
MSNHVRSATASNGVDAALLAEAQIADRALHDLFVAHLGNRIITESHRENSIRIRMILGVRIDLSATRLPVTLAEHAAILDALRRCYATAATTRSASRQLGRCALHDDAIAGLT